MERDRGDIGIAGGGTVVSAPFDRAVRGFLAHRADTAGHLAAARAAEGAPPTAHGLAGFAHLLLGRAELFVPATRALALAREVLEGGCFAPREHHFATALALWCGGDMAGAADRLEALTVDDPRDILAGKLVHAVRFLLGDAEGMRRAVERLLPAWSPALPGYGFVLGWHAFALGETGELAAAERVGRRALEHEPEDVWGCHAVLHVHQMRGEPARGLAWLAAHDDRWGGVNNFVRHLAWHRALCHLALGEVDAVLAIYDRSVRDEATDDYRDIANAASLLYRLERRGIAVGGRWTELAELAERRCGDRALAFAQLHYLFCLVGDGRLPAAARQLAAMAEAAHGEGTQAHVLQAAGLALGRAILARAAGADAPARLTADEVARLGGSRVQRQVFDGLLAGPARGRAAQVA